MPKAVRNMPHQYESINLLQEGNKLLRMGRYRESIIYFKRYLRRYPELHSSIGFNIAYARRRLGLSAHVSKPDVVVFWKQNDTGLYGRRSDMLIKYLAARQDLGNVLVLDAPISTADLSRRAHSHELTHDKKISQIAFRKRQGELDNERLSYDLFIYENKFDQKQYISFLQSVFDREQINTTNTIFWFYPKIDSAEDIIDTFKPGKVVVDIVDDHRCWPGISEHQIESLTEHYRNLLEKADMVFANCQSVIDSMSGFYSGIRLVPNGCESNPEISEPEDNEFYNELKNFSGPILGFVGNLESKIDIPLIENIAKRYPDALIALVGSTHANPAVRDLQKYSNIRLLGVIEYKYINAVVRLFSLGLVPHRKTPLTDNMNPLKVFIYLSNGIPAVCTSVSNIPSCDGVFIARDHEDFLGLCQKLISHELAFSGLEGFIENNSWESRFSPHIDELLAKL
jgi:tetratricopeptide (TPR) repeat protein